MQLKKIIYCTIFCMLFLAVSSVAVIPKISVDLADVRTQDLLQMLMENSNKSVVISEKINSKITINLRDIFWRDALDVVMQMQSLIKHETSNVIIIMPTDEIEKNERLLLQPKVFNLHHIAADGIDKLLKPVGLLSSYGKSVAREADNSLLVSDTKDKLEKLEKILKKIDVPARQVLIEARIVSVDDKFVHELGVELSSSKIKRVDVESPVINGSQGQFNFAIARFGNNAVLDLELAALESEGRGKVISKPKLLTTDRQAAYIESGAEIPYQEKTKEGNTSIAFKKAVLSLKVTPEIADENSVNLFLELSQDKVGQLVVNGVPTIDTRKIRTKVLVHDNETVVLGGIYEWSKSNNIISIPVLGKIPLIKYLFSKKETKMERKELLIFVTPRIINSDIR